MSQKLKLLIADDEPFICSMLAKIIRCDELGIEIAGTAYDGERLLGLIRELNPDIVVTDISMPKMDGLEVIRSVREARNGCRFVIISGYQQYKYAYNSLRYDVDDYLVKPVDEDELNEVIKKIVHSLTSTDDAASGKSFEAIRASFVEEDIYQSRTAPADISQLNEKYHLSLKEGLFRALLVKLERNAASGHGDEDVSSVVNKLHNIVDKLFSCLCHDIVYFENAEGVMALLNFDEGKREDVQACFPDLLQRAKSLANMFQGMGVTICIGEQVSRPTDLWLAKSSVRDAEWARIFYGTDRIIYSEELPSVSNEAFRIKLAELFEQFSEAFKALDVAAFKQCADSLFSCPMNVLRSKETRDFTKDLLEDFKAVNGDRISAFSAPEVMDKKTRYALNRCTRVSAYMSDFVSVISANMSSILQYEHSRDTGLIDRLDDYILAHCSDMPQLARVAEALGTGMDTLCETVLRGTGKNYREYLAGFRIERAKKMLKEGRRPDRAFAAELGYSDVHSFAAEFRNTVGVRPGEYRRIFH